MTGPNETKASPKRYPFVLIAVIVVLLAGLVGGFLVGKNTTSAENNGGVSKSPFSALIGKTINLPLRSGEVWDEPEVTENTVINSKSSFVSGVIRSIDLNKRSVMLGKEGNQLEIFVDGNTVFRGQFPAGAYAAEKIGESTESAGVAGGRAPGEIMFEEIETGRFARGDVTWKDGKFVATRLVVEFTD